MGTILAKIAATAFVVGAPCVVAFMVLLEIPEVSIYVLRALVVVVLICVLTIVLCIIGWIWI